MSDFDFHFDIDDDGVAVLALDRPDTLNSLTFEVYGQLERLFVDLQTDKRVKAIVLTGRGKGFCSGGSGHRCDGGARGGAGHHRSSRRYFVQS